MKIEYINAVNHKMKVHFRRAELRITNTEFGYWDANLDGVLDFELKANDIKEFIFYTDTGLIYRGEAVVKNAYDGDEYFYLQGCKIESV